MRRRPQPCAVDPVPPGRDRSATGRDLCAGRLWPGNHLAEADSCAGVDSRRRRIGRDCLRLHMAVRDRPGTEHIPLVDRLSEYSTSGAIV